MYKITLNDDNRCPITEMSAHFFTEATLDAFRDNSVQSIRYVTNKYFGTEEDLMADSSQFEVTAEVLDLLLCDIVGDV